jgi:outer membrane protein assembly factor BamA
MRTFTILLAGALAIAAAAVAVRGRVLGEVPSASATPALVARADVDPRAVASVRVVGGAGVPVAALERALSTRVGTPLSQTDLDHDRAALVATLEARGHLGAEVTEVRVTWADGAHVVFEVAAGGAYLVDGVKVSGAPRKLADSLARVPTLLRGQPWQPERAADNVALLRDWLLHRDVHADVTARRSVDHRTRTVDVTFEIKL